MFYITTAMKHDLHFSISAFKNQILKIDLKVE